MRCIANPALVLALMLLAACGDSAPRTANRSSLLPFDQMVNIVGEIQLEETDSVINVAIFAALDPRGGFLVTDAREAQMRIYDLQGGLVNYVGRKGDGPAEFSRPVAAMRLSTGEVLVVDRKLKAALFSQDGHTLIRTYRLPFSAVHDADLVDDSTLLVSGALQKGNDDLRAHLWRLGADTVLVSFFSVVIPDAMKPVDASAGFSAAVLRGDTAALTYSLRDTVYLFTTSGTPIRKIPLGSTHFRPATPAPADFYSDPAAPMRWLRSFDLVGHSAWISDGDLAVQYQTFDSAGTMAHRLVRLNRDGRLVSEALDSPGLLLTDPAKGLLYFVHPESETSDRWAVARWR